MVFNAQIVGGRLRMNNCFVGVLSELRRRGTGSIEKTSDEAGIMVVLS